MYVSAGRPADQGAALQFRMPHWYQRRFQQGQAQMAQCPVCPERPEETMHHASLAGSAFAAERAAMLAALEQEVGQQPLLADSPGRAATCGGCGWRRPSSSTWLRRSMRRRSAVPAAAAALVGMASRNPADVACQACGERNGAATMLLCERCDRGYHTRCLVPALPGVPDGDWLCPAFPAGSLPAGSGNRISNDQRPGSYLRPARYPPRQSVGTFPVT
jgi:hypothetical protein